MGDGDRLPEGETLAPTPVVHPDPTLGGLATQPQAAFQPGASAAGVRDMFQP